MADDDIPGVARGLAALHAWLCDFPQLAGFRAVADEAADAASRLSDFDRADFAARVLAVAEEICDRASPPPAPPSTATGATVAWEAVRALVRASGVAGSADADEVDVDVDGARCDAPDGRLAILSALLCHALSDRCARQQEYVGRIVAGGRPAVQQELMRIIQEHGPGGEGDDNDETGDYSAFIDTSFLSAGSAGGAPSSDGEDEDESDGESDGEGDAKRDRTEAFGDEIFHPETPPEKKSPSSEGGGWGGSGGSSRDGEGEGADEDPVAVARVREQLEESRRREADVAARLDEERARHRAAMLQAESRHLRAARDLEARGAAAVAAQRAERDALRDAAREAREAREDNARLRDDLDVLARAREEHAHAEEQLRRCREKLAAAGDAAAALAREERAHAAAVDRCLALEGELARTRPLQRQLEECRVRSADAEAALAECREDLRRAKERTRGLEGAHMDLERDVGRRRAEDGALQRRLQEGGSGGEGGTVVGSGMSELNPELMEEMKMLRSEYTRLKEFEAKREVDAVQRLEESRDDARRLSERFKEQFFRTKSELEDTLQLLRASEAREVALRKDVEDWTKKHQDLGETMKEERLKSQKAALDAERSFQNQKKSIVSKAREELQCLESRLTEKIETERKQHREKMERMEQQRTKIENNLSEQLLALREHSSKTLRTAKELEQKKLDELKQSHRAEIEKLQKERAEEIEALMTKGKGMIRQERQKNKELKRQITEEYEVKIGALQEKNDQVTSFQERYEKCAQAKIAKRDAKNHELEEKHRELIRANDELQEKSRRAESHGKELAGEVQRLRRQLGSRFGPGGVSRSQIDDMTSVCKSLREENRRLKASHPDRLLLAVDESAPSLGGGDQKETPSSLSKAALTQFREDYEARIERLEENKRDLVMKASAAVTETEKAEQRSWRLEEELSRTKSELATTRLALQRHERQSDFSAKMRLSSGKKGGWSGVSGKENTPNVQIDNQLTPGFKREDFTPKCSEPKSKEKEPSKTLMELTQVKNNGAVGNGAQQECKQS